MIGIGIISLVIYTGIEAAARQENQLYLGLMFGGLVALAYRLLVVFVYAKKDGLKSNPTGESIKAAFKRNSSSFLIFLGILIPLIFTIGPIGNLVKTTLNADVKRSFNAISLVMWIPF